MDAAPPKLRWYRLTPGRLLVGLLAVEGLLWLSDYLRWPVYHKGYAVLLAVAAVGVALVLMLLWFAASLLFHWRFQFSIRSLLVLSAVIAIPSGWMTAEVTKAREQAEAREVITREGGSVSFRWEYPRSAIKRGLPPEPSWLRYLLGDDFLDDVVSATVGRESQSEALMRLTQLQRLTLSGRWVKEAHLQDLAKLGQLQSLALVSNVFTDAGVRHLTQLKQLERLKFDFTKNTDSGLQHLVEMPRLRTLIFVCTDVSDDGVNRLARMTRLRCLHFCDAQITDAGLQPLAGLTHLRTLGLVDTKVTDAGLQHLAGMSQLETLYLAGSRVSDAGLAELAGLTGLRHLHLTRRGLPDEGIGYVVISEPDELFPNGARVTDAGVKELQQALPRCEITE